MSVHFIRLIAVVWAYLLTYYLAAIFGGIYSVLLPHVVGGGGFFFYSAFAEQWLAGLPLAGLFFVALAQSIFGPKHLWRWIVAVSAPIILFQLVIDPQLIYAPLILGLFGWLLGTLIYKALRKLTPSFMARIS